ncbi:hypothetical protein Lal_00018574 [Lupinus albus]|nr:hypothetical protein Lal_00018574 [Lupinus albus]
MDSDKVFSNGELTNKVLGYLDRTRKPKVTAIVESKDLDSMSLTTFFIKLEEHEMELGRLTFREQTNKNNKEISLKGATSHSRN